MLHGSHAVVERTCTRPLQLHLRIIPFVFLLVEGCVDALDIVLQSREQGRVLIEEGQPRYRVR